MILEPGSILNNKYNVSDYISKGGMGNIYLVTRLSDNLELIGKEMRFSYSVEEEEAHKLFLREAELIAKFNHPGLPKFYEIFNEYGRYFIIMEYIKGKTLEKIINSSTSPVPVGEAVKWTIEILDILDYLHNTFSSPIVYRDLKPANIIITPEDDVRLIDFGIARYYNPDKNTDTLRLGSPGYAAPEQYKGMGQSCPQSDIFSLGVVLYHMITKYDPTETPYHLPAIKSLNPSITDELEHIILKATDFKTLNRFPRASDFKKVLEKFSVRAVPVKSSSIEDSSNVKSHTIPVKWSLMVNTPMVKSQIIPVNNSYRRLKKFIFPSLLLLFFIVCYLKGTIIYKKYTCINNLKEIVTSIEKYKKSKGLYPPGLDNVVKGQFLVSLPKCPCNKGKKYIYIVSKGRKNYTLYCDGHRSSRNKTLYPQYSSVKKAMIPGNWW